MFSLNTEFGGVYSGQKVTKPFLFACDRGWQRSYVDTDLEVHNIFHLRDPRDWLVSKYFFGTGKKRFQQSEPIDSWVLNQARIDGVKIPLMRVNEYRREALETDTFVTYEDMVLNTDKWLSQVLSHFDLDKTKINALSYHLRQAVKPPPRENPRGHKRQLLPRDHERKLKPKTIALLNEQFEGLYPIE